LRQRALAVAALLVAVSYPLVFALNEADLAVQLPFAIIPVGLAAWVFRWRVALVVVAVETVALSAILRVRDGAIGWPIVEGGGIPTVLLIIVVALSIGFLRQLRDDLTQRASEAEALTDATAAQPVSNPFGSGQSPRVSSLLANTGHLNEHYGNLVTYFRIKGMVPPSSKRQ